MALDKIYCMFEQAKQRRFVSGCKLQRASSQSHVGTEGECSSRALALGAPPKRQANRQRALPQVQLAAPHPLPHPHSPSNAETRGG